MKVGLSQRTKSGSSDSKLKAGFQGQNHQSKGTPQSRDRPDRINPPQMGAILFVVKQI